MKTENLVYNIQNFQSTKTPKGKMREQITAMSARPVFRGNNVQGYDNFEVNKSVTKTTAGQNPSGRLSFKGAPVQTVARVLRDNTSASQVVAKTIGEKFAVNKWFNKFLDILADNSLFADAIFALGLTTIARPASIYIIPAKNQHEKKKNNYQVAHSISTGILGLATTFAVAEPVKRGVKKLMNNPSKYMKKDASYIKENARVFKETAGRLHQPIFLPLRAALTIAIVPPILKMFGLSKTVEDVKPSDKAKVDYSFMSFKGADSKSFKGFAKVKSSYDKASDRIAKANNSTPSFKGAGAMVTEGIAKGVGKLADTNKFKQFILWFKDQKNWFPHLIAGESLWLSGFYMQQTAKSKTIEKDQKLPMILNQGITAALCTWGAYKLDGVINDKLNKYKEVYKRMNPDMVRKSNLYEGLLKRYANNPEILEKLANADKYKPLKEANKTLNNKLIGIRLLGPIVIFTTIYRFVGPVVVTPFANWISEKIQPHKKSA